MFVDASVIVAIVTLEDGHQGFFDKLLSVKKRVTSPVALVEAGLAVARKNATSRLVAFEDVSDFVRSTSIAICEIPADLMLDVLAAYDRYGKGTGHPAKLNMGDCFAYAMAQREGVPLLYRGDDFALTDMA